METIILGDGGMGRAVAAALLDRGAGVPRLLGRPVDASHDPAVFASADVVVEASRGEAVLANIRAAVTGGACRLVVATTAWDADRPAIEVLLREHRAAAVVAPNFSLGVVLFGRLVEVATGLFGGIADFDPYLVEWHRRTKSDRPSGTARDLARRIIAAHPGKQRVGDPARSGAPAPEELEVSVIRAGAAPGMHLVGFDAPGETVELRLTARDRSAYAAGILAAIDWLGHEPRTPGIHLFDPEVVDSLLAVPAAAAA